LIVCHCTGITDRDIRALVRSGAKWNLPCPAESGSAGMHCGGCQLTIERIIRSETETQARAARLPELAPSV
jgi:bacterioferritin-associated ferredoxin